MSGTHKTHEGHAHVHGAGCGHAAVEHNGHVDYLHDGHLHHVHEGHVDEHELGGTGSGCTPQHAACASHDRSHAHGPDCGHEVVPHAGHRDYLVDGHLHHPHGDHCDHHGAVKVRRSG